MTARPTVTAPGPRHHSAAARAAGGVATASSVIRVTGGSS
jgi:hypothetical protein